jgi:hypothetical protein
VKAKGARHPDQRTHIGSRQSNGAHSHQRFIEETQVGDQLLSTGVTTGIRRTSRFRQPCQYQIDHLPPGFIGIAFERLLPRLARQGSVAMNGLGKKIGRMLKQVRKAQTACDGSQLFTQQVERIGAQFEQRQARYVGSDQRMPVTIAANPCAERDRWQRIGIVEQRRIIADLFPDLTQALVVHRQRFGKDVAQIVNGIAQFCGNIRAFEKDVAGAPETLQDGAHIIGDPFAFQWRPHLVLGFHQLQIEFAVVRQHRCPLVFGWMGSEH